MNRTQREEMIAHLSDAARITYRGLEYGPQHVAASTVRGLIDGIREMDHDRDRVVFYVEHLGPEISDEIRKRLLDMLMYDGEHGRWQTIEKPKAHPLSDEVKEALKEAALPFGLLVRPGQRAVGMTAGGSAARIGEDGIYETPSHKTEATTPEDKRG